MLNSETVQELTEARNTHIGDDAPEHYAQIIYSVWEYTFGIKWATLVHNTHTLIAKVFHENWQTKIRICR